MEAKPRSEFFLSDFPTTLFLLRSKLSDIPTKPEKIVPFVSVCGGVCRKMERYGRAGEEGSRSDPSIEWSSHGGETRVEGNVNAAPLIHRRILFLKMRVLFL